jgi:transporter family protein
MGWTAYACLAAIFAALVALFGRIGLGGLDSTLATAVRAAVMAVLVVAFAATTGKLRGIDNVSARAWTFIILSGAAGAASWICYFRALKDAPSTSAVAAIDRSSVVLVFILAAAFLGEALTWKSALGAFLCAGGAALMVL